MKFMYSSCWSDKGRRNSYTLVAMELLKERISPVLFEYQSAKSPKCRLKLLQALEGG